MAEEKKQKSTFLQFILFIIMSLVAFVVQIVIVQFGPKLLELCGVDATKEFTAWIFGNYTMAAFISFLVGNVAAKVISYILNRKKTFGAVNNLVFSMTVYVIMCVALIIAETLIGEPLANAYKKLFASIPALVEWAPTLSMITYSIADFLIVFLMEKFVIMNDNLFKKSKDEAEVVDSVEPVVDSTEEAKEEVEEAPAAEETPVEETPAEEEVKEEAPVEEAPVEEVEETPVVEETVEEAPAAEEAPVEETPAEEEVKEEAPVEEAPVEEVEETPVVEETVEEAPAAEEAPVEETSAEEEVKEEAPVAEEPAKEVKEEPKAKKATAKASGKIDFDLGLDGYHFYILANNNQIMFESQGFASLDTLQNGLETFKKALDTGIASVYQDKNKNYRFIINKRYVGEGYKTRAQAEAAIESVKKFTANGKVLEYVEDPEKKAAYEAAKKGMKKAPKDFDWDKALAVPAKTSGKFTITELEDRGFFFSLAANNGQILYTSRFYSSADSAADAIITFKKAAYLGNFFIDNDKFGNFRYILKGGNGSIVYYGESYSSKDSAISSSESVKKFAASAKIIPFEVNKDEE